MKQPWVNELRGLRPHIRVNFLIGTQVYKDQVKAPRVEEEHLRRLKSTGQLQQGAGRRTGLGSKEHAYKLAQTTLTRSPHSAPDTK